MGQMTHCAEVPLLEPTVVKHCCTSMTGDRIRSRMTLGATVTSGRISATTTYVMWRQEYLWNVSVVQRVRLPNLVYSERLL
jgi:hypothetical protein